MVRAKGADSVLNNQLWKNVCDEKHWNKDCERAIKRKNYYEFIGRSEKVGSTLEKNKVDDWRCWGKKLHHFLLRNGDHERQVLQSDQEETNVGWDLRQRQDSWWLLHEGLLRRIHQEAGRTNQEDCLRTAIKGQAHQKEDDRYHFQRGKGIQSH